MNPVVLHLVLMYPGLFRIIICNYQRSSPQVPVGQLNCHPIFLLHTKIVHLFLELSRSTVQIRAYQSGESAQEEQIPGQVIIQQKRPSVESPFWVTFIFGNISRCNGCKGKIHRSIDGKPLLPPEDIVLGHKEFVIFANPKSGNFEQSWDRRNVYYHPKAACILPNFCNFSASQHIKIGTEVKEKLTQTHLVHLHAVFNISL